MRHACTIRQRAGKIRQLLVQQAACEILIPAGAKDKDSDQVQQQAEPFRQPVLLPGVYHTTQAQDVTLHKPKMSHYTSLLRARHWAHHLDVLAGLKLTC